MELIMDIMGMLKNGLGIKTGSPVDSYGYMGNVANNALMATPMRGITAVPQLLKQGYDYFNKPKAPANQRPYITDDMIMNAKPAYRNVPQGQHEFSGAVDSGSPVLNRADTTNYSQNPNLYQGGPQWQKWMNEIIGGR